MRAGKLNKRIVIQEQVIETKPSGQKVPGEWVDKFRLWAQVKCTDSRAINDDGVIQHEATYKFYIRKRKGITAQMRILWDNRTFVLVGPPVDWMDDRTGLTLIAKELS